MIYLMRHGLDDERYIGGWSDVDLVKKGIKQIEETRNYLEENIKFNYIITSDIKRAVTTANIINRNINKKIIINIDFRELNKGYLTGRLKESLSAHDIYKLKTMTIYDKYPNGESMLEFYKRIKDLLNKIKIFNDVLIVTHRGVINMFYYYCNNIDLDMNKTRFNVEHGSVHECDISKKYIRRIF